MTVIMSDTLLAENKVTQLVPKVPFLYDKGKFCFHTFTKPFLEVFLTSHCLKLEALPPQEFIDFC